MNEASSEARKQTSFATSSGRPRRLFRCDPVRNDLIISGSSAASQDFCTIAVSIDAGEEQGARLLSFRKSIARHFVRPTIACLAEVYAGNIGKPVRAAVGRALRIAPPPAAFRWG